jgi:hypothetical protein
MGGGPSNSPPKQANPFDDEKQLVESPDSKLQSSPTWSWEIADFSVRPFSLLPLQYWPQLILFGQ